MAAMPEVIEIHKYIHRAGDELLKTISNQLGAIMETLAEHTAELNRLKELAAKNQTELLAVLVKLQEAKDSAGNTTPEMDAAIAELATILKATDDAVADA